MNCAVNKYNASGNYSHQETNFWRKLFIIGYPKSKACITDCLESW